MVGDIVEHLLLHWYIAQELWTSIFVAFSIRWLMLEAVRGVLQCWRQRPISLKIEYGVLLLHV